jgi:hypothetical protein
MTVVCLALGACNATQGPLLVRTSATDAGLDASAPPSAPPSPDASAVPSASPPRAAVRSGMSLQYQITGQLDTRVNAEVFVTDLFDTSAKQVADLHGAGRLAIAYVSAGSLENWRADADDLARDAVGMPLSSYPNESWLDTRRVEVRQWMQARFDRAVQKGFDGVFASTLGVYRATSGFDLSRADELEYAIFLADEAHARGLNIGLSGIFELSQQLAVHYDWAIANACIERNSCDELAPLLAAGLAVFDLETSESDREATCAKAKSYAIPVTFKRDGYDAYRSTCP